MPLYSDTKMYYGGASYINLNSYAKHSSLVTSSSYRSPIPTQYGRYYSGNRAGYSPLLPTIGETGTRGILSRVNSPKSRLDRTASPKYSIPKPISINTDDIDVSKNRYQRTPYKVSPTKRETPPRRIEKVEEPTNDGFMQRIDHNDRHTIKRGRTVVRLHTKHLKENPYTESVDSNNNSESFRYDSSFNKSPGTILAEKFLIKENDIKEKQAEQILEEKRRQRELNLSQFDTEKRMSVKRPSLKREPSFHDICKSISSDKLNEETINPVVNRQSTLKEIRRNSAEVLHEHVIMLDEMLKQEEKPDLAIIREDSGRGESFKRKKKMYTRKKSSKELPLDEDENKSLLQRRMTKKLRRPSSGTETPVILEKPVITGSVLDISEEASKSPLKLVVDDITVENNTPTKKKMFKFEISVKIEESSDKSENKKETETPKKTVKPYNAYKSIQIDKKVDETQKALQTKISESKKVEPSVTPKVNIAESSISEEKIPEPIKKSLSSSKDVNSSSSAVNKKVSSDEVCFAKPKALKREPSVYSGDNVDFWEKIGKRETIKFEHRKKIIQEQLEVKRRAICAADSFQEVEEIVELQPKDIEHIIEQVVTTKMVVEPIQPKCHADAKVITPKHEDKTVITQVETKLESNKSDLTPSKKEAIKTIDIKLESPSNVTITETIGPTREAKVTTVADLKQISKPIVKAKLESSNLAKVVATEIKSVPEPRLTQKKPNVISIPKSEISSEPPKSISSKGETEIKKTEVSKAPVAKQINSSSKKSMVEVKSANETKKNSSRITPISVQKKEEIKKVIPATGSKKIQLQKKDENKKNIDSKPIIPSVQQANKLEPSIKVEPKQNITQNNLKPKPHETPPTEIKIHSDTTESVFTTEFKETSTTNSGGTLTVSTLEIHEEIVHTTAVDGLLSVPGSIAIKEKKTVEMPTTEVTPEESAPAPPPDKIIEALISNSAPSDLAKPRSALIELLAGAKPKLKPKDYDTSDKTIIMYATPRDLRRPDPRRRIQSFLYESSSSEEESSEEETDSEEETETDSEEEGEEEESDESGVGTTVVSSVADKRTSTSSNDSGFHSSAPGSPAMANKIVSSCSTDSRDTPIPAHNPAFALESPASSSQSSSSGLNSTYSEASVLESSHAYASYQRSGRVTPPATTIPRFKKYAIEDFQFLKVLGKGSFGKVLLAELKDTEYYYAVKCLKKDIVLEDDDVECTLIERKVLALGTKHPYLCHLFCTFQTDSHLFFVMEYLNGGDLMFHIQKSGRFPEMRARFYGAEIISGLKFLHKKGIVYRDLKLDNVLLDYDGHVRIADFGMCKLQIYLDKTADTFCGTPDYMAPEIIKGQHYNQCVDWWSFGVLMYEMLIGQSPFSGCDEDELFWSICNERPVFPRFLSQEAANLLGQLLEKDSSKRLGSTECLSGEVQDHEFFKQINWMKLEQRALDPPFKPKLHHPLDTQYFDKAFTQERARLTPINEEILRSMDQIQFQGFSYTNPNATDH